MFNFFITPASLQLQVVPLQYNSIKLFGEASSRIACFNLWSSYEMDKLVQLNLGRQVLLALREQILI
jgi:hypothetical protein